MTALNKKNKADGRRLTHPTWRNCYGTQTNEHCKRGAYYDQGMRQRLKRESNAEVDIMNDATFDEKQELSLKMEEDYILDVFDTSDYDKMSI